MYVRMDIRTYIHIRYTSCFDAGCLLAGAIALGGGLYPGDRPTVITNVSCSGSEGRLLDCPAITDGGQLENCDDAVVVCQGAQSGIVLQSADGAVQLEYFVSFSSFACIKVCVVKWKHIIILYAGALDSLGSGWNGLKATG